MWKINTMKDERDKVESVSGSVASEVSKIKYRKFGLVALIVVGVAAAMFGPSFLGGQSTPDDYADAGEDTVHRVSNPAAATFNITSIGVSPASHTVQLGESVKFVNRLDSRVSLSFDRSNDTVALKPGSSQTLMINGITYFRVAGKNYSARGRVNIQ